MNTARKPALVQKYRLQIWKINIQKRNYNAETQTENYVIWQTKKIFIYVEHLPRQSLEDKDE